VSARLLDGRELATRLRRELHHRLETAVGRSLDEPPADEGEAQPSHIPELAIVTDGASSAAGLYAASLERASRAIGVPVRLIGDPDSDERTIDALNADPQVAGIVIAQPFADHARARRLVERIDPDKDVDGATPTNAGRLARGEPAFVPATALAVVAMLDAYRVEVAGRRAVVVGRSAVVGRPVASLLLARDATVVVCHRRTRNLARETRRAEILVAAAGVPGLIRPEMVNRSAVVVDCGITAVEGGIAGDVDFANVAPVVRAITPVPGGIGPVTPMMVLRQLIESAERLAPTRNRPREPVA
jgi:methylenetetrahydrofolate dehydrogenase (NADP+)/methenyltetrahydrofolate cyclohydrolase